MCSHETNFIAANFHCLPRIETKKHFVLKFVEQQVLHVNNICFKFSYQKINTKKTFIIYQHVLF